jgi:phosphoglucosamine mutase
MAALQILAELVRTGRRASEACNIFTPLPQILRNVVFRGKSPLDDKAVKAAIADGESRLAQCGRLLIRKSGTEPKIRVMAEGEDRTLVGTVVDDICSVIEEASAS